MKIHLLLGLLVLSVTIQGKVCGRCELVRTLKKLGMDGFTGISLWHCKRTSNYNVRAANHNAGGTGTDYWIFQINTVNSCGITCTALLQDDITGAVVCAEKSVSSALGIDACVAWKAHCENQGLTQCVPSCGV
uniref:lysozyme n=1 Tax=Chinchilla lanigera TaxID=34839 RepID=A0A8C2VIW1_CHILA